MPQMPLRLLSLWLVLAAFAPAAEPARGWVHVNGYSYHINARDCNSLLLGSGVTWYTRYSDRLHTAWEADAFADSARKLSAYVGYSAAVPWRGFAAGGTVAVMYHRNFAKQNRLRTMPVAFPFLEADIKKVKVRVYYVPGVRSTSDEQVAVQLLLPVWR